MKCTHNLTKGCDIVSGDGPFVRKGRYEIGQPFPDHFVWLPPTRDDVDSKLRSSLEQLRQKLRLALHALLMNPRSTLAPLPILDDIFISYTELLQHEILHPADTAAIARLVSMLGMSQPTPISQIVSRCMGIFAAQYITKKLPPHPTASEDLLGYYYTTSQPQLTMKLWEWLRQQDGSYVSTELYGDAIECLLQFDQPLHTCEELYDEALERCSSESSRHLLTPGAMIPRHLQAMRHLSDDRRLCRQMNAAWLRRGDWRKAYLHLDTALRMWPDSPPNQLLKNMVKSRPAHESYQVYFMCCQGRPDFRPKDLFTLLNTIVQAQASSEHLLLKAVLARSLVGAILAGVKSRSLARLDEKLLGVLLRGCTSLLRNVDFRLQETGSEIDRAFLNFLDYLIVLFLAWGVAPTESVITPVIHMSGKLKRVALL